MILEESLVGSLLVQIVWQRLHITSSVMIFFTSSLEAPRSYLDGILKNSSRFCAMFQRRAWRESLFMSSVELHIYGVCDTAVLHGVHSSCTCIHLHTYPLHTYITYRLHNEVKVLPHARPRRPQKYPTASRGDAMTRLLVRVRVWAAGRMARP